MNIEQFYRDNSLKQTKMMSRILANDYAAAEDVVHEAYTRAIQYLDSYNPDRAKFSTWFNKILFNSLRDIQQEYKNRPTEDINLISTEDVHLPQTEEDLETYIWGVKNDKHQQVLYLFFILGYDSKEISQIEEDMSQTNVTTIVNRFKQELCDKLT